MKRSKKSLRIEIEQILLTGDRKCRATGEELSGLIDRLIFHGAGVYELRGASSADLSADTWNRILSFAIPFEKWRWYASSLGE